MVTIMAITIKVVTIGKIMINLIHSMHCSILWVKALTTLKTIKQADTKRIMKTIINLRQ